MDIANISADYIHYREEHDTRQSIYYSNDDIVKLPLFTVVSLLYNYQYAEEARDHIEQLQPMRGLTQHKEREDRYYEWSYIANHHFKTYTNVLQRQRAEYETRHSHQLVSYYQ